MKVYKFTCGLCDGAFYTTGKARFCPLCQSDDIGLDDELMMYLSADLVYSRDSVTITGLPHGNPEENKTTS